MQNQKSLAKEWAESEFTDMLADCPSTEAEMDMNRRKNIYIGAMTKAYEKGAALALQTPSNPLYEAVPVDIYNTMLPKSTEGMLASTVRLREPDQNRDTEHSALHDCIMSNICESLKIHTDKETFHKAWTSSLFPERATKAIMRGVEEFIKREGYLTLAAQHTPSQAGEVEKLKKTLADLVTVIDRDLIGKVDNDDLGTATDRARKLLYTSLNKTAE